MRSTRITIPTGPFFLGGLLAVLVAAASWRAYGAGFLAPMGGLSAAASSLTNGGAKQEPEAAASIGSGDGRIHIIPTLSGPSVKNGGKLTISAVVKAQAGVQSVVADLGGIETITLKPAAGAAGGAGTDSQFSNSRKLVSVPAPTVGLWSAEWTAHGLEEKVYTVALRVADRSGHVFEDRSLQFSDPAAGYSTPGTTAYPNAALARIGAANNLLVPEADLSCGVADVAAGYAYFGTDTIPGIVVKVALGSGSAAPTRVGALTLNSGENYLSSAVIDPAAGYAYFGTNTSPGIVVKVALGSGSAAPTRVGALTLNSGENYLSSAVVDPTAGYAYFGTDTSPAKVVKVALGSGAAAPTRVGALTLDGSTGEFLCSAVIDPGAGYAYFGTNNPAMDRSVVVKVALGSGAAAPTFVGAVALNSGERCVSCAVIDPAAGYVYFGTTVTSPGIVVKVALGSGSAAPTRVGALALNSGEENFTNAVIDPGTGYAYFGTDTFPGIVVKVALGSGAAVPTRVGALTVNNGEDHLASAVIDPTAGYAYFGTDTSPGKVVKVALGSGSAAPTRVGALTVYPGDIYLSSAVIDPAAGYAYFGTNSSPGVVVKVALGSASAGPTRVGALTLNSGENSLYGAVIDPAAGYAYFGTYTSPGIVVKVALGSGSAAPTRVGALTLNSGENQLTSAVIDPAAGYAYFGAYTSPGIVVKVALGTGAAAPTRVGAVTLKAGEDDLWSAVIDPGAGYAYFGTDTSPGKVVKVALGSGSAAPTHVGALSLNSGENTLYSAVIDPGAGYAYFGTNTSPGIVVKVALGSGGTSPARVGAVTLNSGENILYSSVIDPGAGYAYFGTYTIPGIVVKVALGSGSAAPTRVGALALNSGEDYVRSAVSDPAAGYAYFGTYNEPGIVVKTTLSENGVLKATKLTMPEAGNLTDVRFYSHAAIGNVRLALYDNAAAKNLLWQSASIANSAAGDFLIASISSGTPSSLQLSAGIYWLGWQVNTNADVPSYTAGAAGDGFYLGQPYGALPGTITGETATAEKWTEYITYTLVPAKLAFTTQPSSSTGGIAFATQPGVTVQDANGNTVTTDASSVTLAIGTNPGNGTLGGTKTVAALNGVATFSGLSIDKAGAGYTLTATDGALTGATSNTFNISAGPAAKLVFTTQPGGGTGGIAFATQPAVTVQDANGNTVTTDISSVTLAIGTNPGNGTLSGTKTVAAVNGVATFSGLSIDKVGTGYTLTATDGALTGATSNTFNTSVGPAAKLVFTTQPGSGTGGAALATQPVVTVQDAGGNTVTTDSPNVTLAIGTNPSGGTLSGTKTVVASSGVATFNGLSIDKGGNGYTLAATDGALTGATSNTFNISVGLAAKLVFTTQPGSGTGGTALATQPVVTVQDAGGNTVTTDSSNVTLAIGTNPSGGTLSGTKTVAASSGLATFSGLSIDKAGKGYTLTATDGALTAATSSAFNIAAPPASTLEVTGFPTPATAGTAGSVTVTAKDSGGNTATGYTGTVHFTSSDAAATLPADYTFVAGDSGSHAFSNGVTLNTAGTQTISATDKATSSITGTQSGITVNPGPFTQLQIVVPGETAAPGTSVGKTGTPNAQTAGSPFGVIVNAVDANWNVVTSVGDSVGLASNDARAVLPPGAALATGTGKFSVTLYTAFSGTLTAGDSTTPTITPGTSAPIPVGNGTFSSNPQCGPLGGGGTFTITGNGFLAGAGVSVLFGSQSVPGTVSSDGKSVTCKVPAASGVAKVDVKVINGDGNSATLPAGFYYTAETSPETFSDSDQDGYPDALENALGTKFPSTLTPGPEVALTIRSLKMQFNFAKQNGTVTLAGTLSVRQGLALSSQTAVGLFVGNVAQVYKLDAKGKGTATGPAGKDSFSLAAKLDRKTKLTVGGAAKFTCKLNLPQNGLAALADVGLVNDTVTRPSVPLSVVFLFDGTDFRKSVAPSFKAVKNKRGSATYPVRGR